MHPYISSLTSYQVMMLIAVGTVIITAFIFSRKKPVSFLAFIEMLSFMLIGALIGAKLLSLITRLLEYGWNEKAISEPGGLVFYGGLLIAIVSAYIGSHIAGYSSEYLFNNLAFLIPLAHGIGRIGCFLVGCCYGIPYTGPFSVVFPEGGNAPAGIPLFPVQLAEAIMLFMLSAYLFFRYTLKERKGALQCYLIIYAVMRFFLEFLRGDYYRGIYYGLSTSQWISIAILLFFTVKHIWKAQHPYSAR